MLRILNRDPLFFAYLKWHYNQGLKEFFIVARNFLWFVTNFFSFKLLIYTLFTPWKRLNEIYQGNLDSRISSFIVNFLMRGVGFVTRTIILLIGFSSYFIVALFIFCLFVVWFLAPFLLMGSIILSITFFVI